MNDLIIRRLGRELLVLTLLLSISACTGKPEGMQTLSTHPGKQDNAGYNDSLIGDAYADEGDAATEWAFRTIMRFACLSFCPAVRTQWRWMRS